MTEFRNDLLDRMIRIYGFEHKLVIAFAELVDRWEENEWNNTVLKTLVEGHEANPYVEEN